MNIAKIHGVTIKINPALLLIWLIAVLLGIGAQTLLIFVFVLGHELCHTLVAQAFGVTVQEIELMPFGGVARMQGRRLSGGREVLIAFAGPLFNGICAAIGLALVPRLPAYFTMLSFMARLNITLALFNLIPAFPLDGGRILRGLLCGMLGQERATRVASILGVVLGIGLLLYVGYSFFWHGILNMALAFMGAALCGCAAREGRSSSFSRAVQMREKRKRMHGSALMETILSTGAETRLEDLVPMFQHNAWTRIRIYNAEDHLLGEVSEREVVDAYIHGRAHAVVGELLRS